MIPARFIGLAAFLMIGFANLAEARDRFIQHCYLQVEGRTYLDQPCIFASQQDGSFTIGTSAENADTGRMPFFAYVNMNGDGTATGYWNEDASNTHAASDLGRLKRSGACWQNAQAKVCAE